MQRQNRFWTALAVYVVLGILEWTTLSGDTVKVVTGLGGEPLFELSVRGIALAILGLFAVRTLIQNMRMKLEEASDRSRGD
jgi:hypothetical protein